MYSQVRLGPQDFVLVQTARRGGGVWVEVWVEVSVCRGLGSGRGRVPVLQTPVSRPRVLCDSTVSVPVSRWSVDGGSGEAGGFNGPGVTVVTGPDRPLLSNTR